MVIRDRQRLEEKRRLLLLRRNRAASSEPFRSAGRILCERKVRFSKAMPAECVRALGPLTSGPGQDERLVWASIPNGVCRSWNSPHERDRLVRSALTACTAPENQVVVVWHPDKAGLKILAGTLADNLVPILDQGGDTIWIVAPSGGWLIEAAYWDREICYTRSMPIFGSPGPE